MRRAKSHRQRGISLIEVAIAMTVAGLLLGAYLQYALALREKARYENTHKHMGQIRTALAAYAARHGRLPCPQSPTDKSTKAHNLSRHSMEEGPGNDDKSCAPEAVAAQDITVSSSVSRSMEQDDEVWTGVVPARVLGLKSESTLDGWGRLFTYAVSRRLTLPHGLAGSSTPPGVISVVNEAGENLLDREGGGRYVVLSHGPSGAGGWTEDAVRLPCDRKTLDGQNCDGDAVFVIAPFSRKKGKFFFDDFVAHDDPDAGGTLLDKMMNCNMQRKFYAPQAQGADSDGCRGTLNLLEGACILSKTEDAEGKIMSSPPIALIEPAVSAGDRCACKEGYTAFEVGTWDDKSRTGINMAWTNNVPGSAKPGQEVFQTDQGTEVQRDQEKYRTRTSLFTCIQ